MTMKDMSESAIKIVNFVFQGPDLGRKLSEESRLSALAVAAGAFCGTHADPNRVIHLFLESFAMAVKGASAKKGEPIEMQVTRAGDPSGDDCNRPKCILRRTLNTPIATS